MVMSQFSQIGYFLEDRKIGTLIASGSVMILLIISYFIGSCWFMEALFRWQDQGIGDAPGYDYIFYPGSWDAGQ
jgi:hypothetical protein